MKINKAFACSITTCSNFGPGTSDSAVPEGQDWTEVLELDAAGQNTLPLVATLNPAELELEHLNWSELQPLF